MKNYTWTSYLTQEPNLLKNKLFTKLINDMHDLTYRKIPSRKNVYKSE